jgi:ArsR family transcriptional regulator, arsenate/arsenite/antimonite-responsive transcriptional repressor
MRINNDATVRLLAALADSTRLAALAILWDGKERCVCELMRTLGATQSRMSRHMGALKAAGLVIDRRDAQWVRYRRNPGLAPKLAAVAEAAIKATATDRKKAA